MRFDTKDLVKAITPHKAFFNPYYCSFRVYFDRVGAMRIGFGCCYLPQNRIEKFLGDLISASEEKENKTIPLTQDMLVDPIQKVKEELLKVRPCSHCGGTRFENRIKKEKLDGKIKSW